MYEFPTNAISGVFSIPYKNCSYKKGKLQRILIKGKEIIQISLFTEKQVFHNNVDIDKLNEYLNDIISNYFRSIELNTSEYLYSYKISSKGKLLTNKRLQRKELVVLEHNKKKQYLIEEGVIVPPLIDLGIMTNEGKVVKAKFDKFKQINRFLEMIDDSIKSEKKLKIIDFGCGKSYLTFILYYYLVFIRNISCQIIGLDLKEDVIDNCNKIALKYNYTNLTFMKGNIADFQNNSDIDMIITLHACDTATDYALFYAIRMKCKYIFSVPCCQHEINLQLNNKSISPISRHGILRERFSAILTDSVRANILEYYGYKTQILEFVDWEATPKNVLIRAILESNCKKEAKEEVEQWLTKLNIKQKLYELCFSNEKNLN